MTKGWSSIAWTIVAVLTAASLAGAVLLSAGEKNYAFYLTPFRAWEFAAGGAVWILRPALERRSYLIADGLGASGLALLLGSLLFLTEALSYPSWLALFPVVGTTAVILSCGARPDSWLARGLSLRPLCFIGLISYSWYLWHWPLLSFGRISRMGARDLASDLGMAGLAAILAVATWFLVEKPIRAHRAAILRLFKPRIVVAASLSLCAVLFAVALVFLNVLAARGPTIMELDQAALEATLKGDVCAVRPERPLTGKCLQELSSGRWGILMGDSFARTSYPHLAELAKRNHIRLVTIYQTGCRPVFGTLEVKPDERCKSIFEVTIAKLAALHSRPEFVVLRSHWHAKSHALGGQNDGEEAALLQKALHSTLERLTVIGAPRVLIVGTHPNRQNQPSCLSRVLRQGLPPSRCERAAKDVAEQEAVYVSALAAAARAVPGTTVIHPSTVFCEAQTCLFTLDGQPAYTDDKHLTQAAEGLLFRSFAEEFRWVIEGRARGEAVIVLRTASSPVTSPPSIRSRPLPRGSSEADWARINWWVCRGQNPVLHERGLAARHEPAAPWGAPSHRVPGR
jgi:hypothetical protein